MENICLQVWGVLEKRYTVCDLCSLCSRSVSSAFGLLANCSLAFWPILIILQDISSNHRGNKGLDPQIFRFFLIFGISPAWESSKLPFAWNVVGRSCFGEVDHGRRQKSLPAMRTCKQKQKPMLWFLWGVRQLQSWAALFLSVAGRSCLLRYSWLGENSNLFERWIEVPPPNRARMAGGGEGHRVELRNPTRRLLYHRVCVCQLENHHMPPFRKW